jgi:hypothetical protein
VPVVYCYMDDLALWFKRTWMGKATPNAAQLQSPPKIDALPRTTE